MTEHRDSGPYSRVYWRFADEYPDIYQDDRALGTWLRLLVIAEGSHPSAGHLPRRLHAASLDKLVAAQLVTLLSGDRFHIKGLAEERTRRASEQRSGGHVRAETAERGPDGRFLPSSAGQSLDTSAGAQRPSSGPAIAETSRDEQSKDETSTPRPILVSVKGMDGSTSEIDVTERQPSSDWQRLRKLVSELTAEPYPLPNPEDGFGKVANGDLERHGFDRVARAYWELARRMKVEGTSRPTVKQLIFGATDALNPVPKADEKANRQVDEQAAFDRRVARTRAQYVDPYYASLNDKPEEKPA